MSEPPTFRTGLGDSDAEHIRLSGFDPDRQVLERLVDEREESER